MKDFKPGQQIVCIHDDFNLFKEGGKPLEGPKQGDIVTFEGYISNKSFLLLKEHKKAPDGREAAWNSNKFAPLEDDKELMEEAAVAIEELTEETYLV